MIMLTNYAGLYAVILALYTALYTSSRETVLSSIISFISLIAESTVSLSKKTGTIEISVKPTDLIIPTYSSASTAPATHPAQALKLFLIASGSGPSVTISDTASLPPGFNTRNASVKTLDLSGDRLITQLEMMTSTVLDSTGKSSR